MAPVPAPAWTAAQLNRERNLARAAYRKARVEEPIELYTDEYETFYQSVAELLELTVDLTDLRAALPEVMGDKNLWRALRYVTGPPISDDDLRTVAEVELTQTYLKAHPDSYDAIADAIFMTYDRKRFPWIEDQRDATEEERQTALVSSAAMVAYQRVQSVRRNQARRLEHDVADVLVAAGFTQVNKRAVNKAADWPKPGEFCGEAEVAGRQADLIVTLFDSRYFPIECKVSGSALNSIKRLNNDSLAKFADWTKFFGAGQTVPVAVLEGVYSLERLQAAQTAGATIFWSHGLARLRKFLKAAH